MQSSFESLGDQIRDLGVRPSMVQEAQLRTYLTMLERWSQSMNLTALEGARMTMRLIAEPLWVAQELQPSGRYLDVGSGNGSPGLPWHVLRRFASVDLVESRRRRAVFLQQAVHRMGLPSVTVMPSRVEDIASSLRPVDWITLQGVKLTRKLLEQLSPLSSETTRLVWFTKGSTPPVDAERHLTTPTGRSAFVFCLWARTSSGSG